METSDEQKDRVLHAANQHHSELLAYARALLGNYDAAEDTLQEAMLVVGQKYDQFEEGTSIVAWCRSIVRFEVLRAKQKYHRERTLAERLLEEEIESAFKKFQSTRQDQEIESKREALRLCLEQIPARSRGLLRARFTDELSYTQIGTRLGMSIEAVRKALFRLKKQIRSCVEIRLRETE